ncbi:hypothetical protein [Konateibacter massiliensis]|uniref:hypothetical protein n=1 Tax=Konateibacter massiliensis TaxID=2002841 RepID=UPI000C157B46|nr:hypothetical protein [Konateibacter massiliensis]
MRASLRFNNKKELFKYINKKKLIVLTILTILVSALFIIVPYAYPNPANGNNTANKKFANKTGSVTLNVRTTDGLYGTYVNIITPNLSAYDIWLGEWLKTANTTAKGDLSIFNTTVTKETMAGYPGYMGQIGAGITAPSSGDMKSSTYGIRLVGKDSYTYNNTSREKNFVRQAGKSYKLTIKYPTVGYKLSAVTSSNDSLARLIPYDTEVKAGVAKIKDGTNEVDLQLWSWSTTAISAWTPGTGKDFSIMVDLQDIPGNNVTLEVKFDPYTYYVSYNGNGATGGSTGTSTHTYDA